MSGYIPNNIIGCLTMNDCIPNNNLDCQLGMVGCSNNNLVVQLGMIMLLYLHNFSLPSEPQLIDQEFDVVCLQTNKYKKNIQRKYLFFSSSVILHVIKYDLTKEGELLQTNFLKRFWHIIIKLKFESSCIIFMLFIIINEKFVA